MSKAEYEQGIKIKLGNARGSAVDLPNGGTAYVRCPTNEEYLQQQTIDSDQLDIWVPAYKAYVAKCFLGACDANGADMTYDDVMTVAGPAFVVGGPLGLAVNRLAGSRPANRRDL